MQYLSKPMKNWTRPSKAFARIIALTDGKPEAKQINDQVRENLENYYKYRHKNTDGLQALINKYKK